VLNLEEWLKHIKRKKLQDFLRGKGQQGRNVWAELHFLESSRNWIFARYQMRLSNQNQIVWCTIFSIYT